MAPVFVRNYFYFLRQFLCTVTPIFQEPSPKELADIMEGYGSRKYAEKWYFDLDRRV